MKNLFSLATIATTIITLLTPVTGKAQGVFVQPFPSTGYSSTTIYVPSIPQDRGYANDINTTTIIDPTSPNIYPNSNSFPGSINTPYYGSSYPNRRYIPSRQPTVIFPQQNFYPRGVQSACTTSIIGSPIPSPIALNRYTGTPCR
jgi:hypothetical protein